MVIFFGVKNKRRVLGSAVFTNVLHADYGEIARDVFTSTVWTSSDFHTLSFYF
jgi:hypothetical protein